MPPASRRDLLRFSFVPLLSLLASSRRAGAASIPLDEEVRGLWVTRSWMTTPAQVAQVVTDARRHGITAIFAQARGRGDAFYRGGPDPRSTLLARQPAGFDPLAELVARAQAAGVQVHAWLNANLVSGATGISTSPQHVLVQHPEWLMVPRDLAGGLLGLDPRDRRYVARLAGWSQRHSATIEGLFTSPIHEGAQDRLVAVIDHLTRQYTLDGLHLDYVRYPSADFDYSRAALDAFRTVLLPELTPAELATMDGKAKRDPFAFVTDYASRWTAFRRARLAHLVTRLRDTARTNRPSIRVTAAVWPDAEDARQRKLQDWPGWLRAGLVDAVCPMMYTSARAAFERQLQALAQQPAGSVWPGIGAFKITAAEAAHRVDVARAMGFSGVLLYSYDSMSGGAGRPSTYLAAVQRRAFPTVAYGEAGASR